MLRAVCLLLVMCWVAACSDNAGERAPAADPDPVIRQALDGLMMTDMDLSARNEANAALTINYDHSLPPIADSRATIDTARQEAADLLGGGSAIEPLPGDMAYNGDLPIGAAIDIAALAGLTHAECLSRLTYGAAWAADWPEELPIYPRAGLREAAGHAGEECDLRAASFLTPVGLDDVAGFYLGLAAKTDLVARAVRRGETVELALSGNGVWAHLYLAATPEGHTRLDIVVRRDEADNRPARAGQGRGRPVRTP